MRALLCLVFLATLVIGCTPTYQQTRQDAAGPKAKLPAESSVLVALPRDGRYVERLYFGSGLATAEALLTALEGRVKRAERTDRITNREDGLAQARTKGFDYYAEPRILHWEDRATAWSGKSDIIIIEVTLLEVASGEEIDSATISGQSQWFTFTDEPPTDLLAEPLNSYVAELVQ